MRNVGELIQPSTHWKAIAKAQQRTMPVLADWVEEMFVRKAMAGSGGDVDKVFAKLDTDGSGKRSCRRACSWCSLMCV